MRSVIFVFAIWTAVVDASEQLVAQQAKTLNISGLAFQLSTQHDQQGALDMLLNDLLKQINQSANYQVVNAARAFRKFSSKQADCIIPSVPYDGYFTGLDVIHSDGISLLQQSAFTVNGKEITSKQDLNGKVVGMLRGVDSWDFQKRIDADLQAFVGVNDLPTLVKMLHKGRIDVAIHDRFDFELYTELNGYKKALVHSSYNVWEDNIVITCHDTEHSKELFKHLKPHIARIKQENKLAEYYEKALALAFKQSQE